MSNTLKSRIYKFDNIKFLVILLVVVGHTIENFVDKSDMFKSLFIFIYSFHMPLFIFISGLFQKRFDDNNKLKINKIAYFLTLGFALKTIMYGINIYKGNSPKYNFFGGSSIEWFLFVLAMFMVTAYLCRKVNPAIMLSVSFLISLVSGYFDFIDDTLYLSRYFVFLPMYLIGYYLTPQKVQKLTDHIAVRISGIVVLITYFVLCFRKLNLIYQLRRLFTGKNPFSTLPFENCSFEHRLLCFCISAVLCIAVISIIPDIKIPILSNMGANTLAVYFLHNPILHLLRTTPLFAVMLNLGDPLYKIVMLTFGVLLGLVLSLNIFMKPFALLQKLMNKLKPVWCYVIIACPFVLGVILNAKDLIGYIPYLIKKSKS